MPEHCLTVLAAVLGLVDGRSRSRRICGQPRTRARLEQGRARHSYGMRIDTYVKFLRAAEREHFEPVETGDLTVRTAEAEARSLLPTPRWPKRRHGSPTAP
jgi:hypothetical protein